MGIIGRDATMTQANSGTVVDCASYCAVRRLAWLGRMVFAGIVQRRGPMLKIGSQHRTQLRSFGSDARLGPFSNTVHHGSSGNSLRHHNRQHSRSRSPASNPVGSCPICLERPKDHCLVPCGHRTCLQCGSRCLPICPQCRGTCTQCMRVFD